MTSHEVTVERLALSIDMLDLVAVDAELPAHLYDRVHALAEGLRAVWEELRLLP